MGFGMEFHEKLQELRRQKGLTQEELAASLYVSRTAISKWESGRGYPSIESLRVIAGFFSVTVDDLLSAETVLIVAEEQQKQTKTHVADTVRGLLDVCMSLLLFLPLFAERAYGVVASVSLLSLTTVQTYLKISYIAAVIALVIIGVLTLALQNCQATAWVKSKTLLSFAFGAIATLLFILTLQPYPAVFALALLAVKAFWLVKKR